MMKTKMIAGMAAIGLFLSAGVASAQTMNESGKANSNTGNSKMGGAFGAYAKTQNNKSLKKSLGNMKLKLRLFKKNYKMTQMDWAVKSKAFGAKKDKSNFMQIRIGGLRIYSEKGVKEIARRWSKKYTALQLERTIPVGAYWLNLEARAGLQLDVEIAIGVYTGRNNELENIGLRSRMGGAIYMDCTAAADFGISRIGLRAKCKLINMGVRGWVKVNDIPNGVSTVDCDYTFYEVPVVFTLKAICDRLKIKRKGWRIKRTWKEFYSVVLARWIPGNTNLSERSFLTY